MKFSNKKDAIAFIESSGVSIDQKVILSELIETHALDREVKVIGSGDEITSLLFEADHDVESHIELDCAIIDVHSLAGVSSVTNQSKENIMTAQNQTAATAQQLNDMEAMIAASMKKIMESSLDGILEAALVKQQARIDETVKKTVDEAMKKAIEEMAKTTPKAEEPKKPTPEQTKEAASGLAGTLGKTAAYLAGAAAIATGGYFAWQKWGGSSSAPAAE